MSPKRRKSNILPISRFRSHQEAASITVTEKSLQKRFFCENCKREVFLEARYCDNCGGQIEWPESVQKIRASWRQ